MFRLSTTALEPGALARELANPRAGALAIFEGWVRNHDDARAVQGLEYETFGQMAESLGREIVENACERFSLLDALVVHRIGHAQVSDLAIWVGVTAEHRQEAFLACRWIVDRIKEELPIWKKESYVDDASSTWVHAGASSLSNSEDPATHPYYTRQVNLDELGPAGQRKLAASKVLVIGAGGLGCPALQYLAAAGVGNLRICDGDRIDETNLHRQILFAANEIGQNKAEVAAERMRSLNPQIAIAAIADAATQQSLPELVSQADLVLDCTDSFEAKYMIHDACWQAGTVLVQAAVYQFEGQVQVIDPQADAGCFRCLWPEAPPAGCVGNCAQAGVLGVTPGLLGIYQAIEALKILLNWPSTLRDATLLVDVLSGQTQRIQRSVRDDCVCQNAAPWPDAPDNILFPGQGAAELLKSATLVDLREDHERREDPEWLRGLARAPRAKWPTLLGDIEARPLVLVCSAGLRSRECVATLANPAEVYAWTRPIEELERYCELAAE
jgi:sulfur-carrier protein adenylyltransferase/sulfurtransferase